MAKQLRIVMAQLDFLVGDIPGNTEIVLEQARRALDEFHGDMVVFPELALTGYPPEDLLLRPSLEPRIARAMSRLLDACLDIYLVVGFPEKKNDKLYNSLAVIKGNELLAVYRKQHLPNYQVFDEMRYFEPGSDPCVVGIQGVPVAFTVCEDMWESGPTLQAAAAGAVLLVNINASPYHLDKVAERRSLLGKRATEGRLPIIYVNLVGGQDELVFDGSSMVIDAAGDIQMLAPAFEPGLYPVTVVVAETTPCRISLPRQEIFIGESLEAEIYSALVIGTRDYVNKNGFKGVVLGLSGGIDSALTLAIAVDALGSDRVQAVMMPFDYTSELSRNAARQQAELLQVEYRVIPIAGLYNAALEALDEEFARLSTDVTEQNIQARCRGLLLMAISNKKGLLVLTTGNKSELAVGYSTLYGDMAGGFDSLKDVSKTMVYRLANYRNTAVGRKPQSVIPEAVIERPPSAELAPDQTDQDALPAYDVLDAILELYIESDLGGDSIVAKGFDETVVKKVLRLVDINEYKRRQSPVGVRLTQRGFGRDRRYPITNAWKIGE
ncbi:MAG: NAD+ synthase [Pseudohongiellaceae bacterium]